MQRTVCDLIYFKILFIKNAHSYMVCAHKTDTEKKYVYIYVHVLILSISH